MPLLIALTGGIGSGKSTAANIFQELGADIVDADTIAHQLTQPNAAGTVEIQRIFGENYFQDGVLNRAKLRQHVFMDPQARERLESVLHPLVQAEILHQMTQWQTCYGIAVIPLLLEKKRWVGQFHRILVVDCSEETQIRRVQQRSQLKAEEIRAIMASQVNRATRLAAADDVIDNDLEIDKLLPQVIECDHRFRKLADHTPLNKIKIN